MAHVLGGQQASAKDGLNRLSHHHAIEIDQVTGVEGRKAILCFKGIVSATVQEDGDDGDRSERPFPVRA